MTIREAVGVVLIAYSFIIPLIIIVGLNSKIKILLIFIGNTVYMISIIICDSISNSIGFYNNITLVLSPLIQELGRFVMFSLINATDKIFSQHLRENQTLFSQKESISESQTYSVNSIIKDLKIINFINAAFFSGVGFAFGQITNHLLMFIIDLSGPGSPFYNNPKDDYFILLTSGLAAFRAIDNISWNIIMFVGIDRKTWFGPAVVIILHCSLTQITSYVQISETAGTCIIIVVSFSTISCAIWAFQIAGGKISRPPCFKEVPLNENYSTSVSQETNSIRGERKESLDVVLNQLKRSSLAKPPLLKKIEPENKKINVFNPQIQRLQSTQHVSFQ